MTAKGDLVKHGRFGLGRVLAPPDGGVVLVQFDGGIQAVSHESLQKQATPEQAAVQGEWHHPLEALTRCQAELIQSLNDAWGVFSRSRIHLLPHQLWVCRQVTRSLPARWLVADDVGLGKTVEAGLIIQSLMSRGEARRMLILCPASLVEQWQHRLLSQFDIRLTRHTPEADTEKSGFWRGGQLHVIASLHTLRKDEKGRWGRLAEADPWDLVLVDEAHHLNADEDAGPTLGHQLIARLEECQRIRSLVFLTGTPHRGKEFGFLALMKLLRPDLFDPGRDLAEQVSSLRLAMIRNNKQNVTDLNGLRQFKPPVVRAQTYAYSPAEARFYGMLTEFILSGKAYASKLGAGEQRTVMLVLIALQKLASSSVAAIRRALRGRLGRLSAAREQAAALLDSVREYEALEEEGDPDRLAALEEQLAALAADVRLVADEEGRLRELLAAADEVKGETKVARILELLEGPFAGRSVLFFTEYKATQALLLSALLARYGPRCAAFINGDEQLDEVSDGGGEVRTIRERRERAAERLNSGEVRFLISTEAGGEGIDLQQRCHSLVHVDMPWNPMRLHQRVGRVNRYGQKEQVEVFLLRNPDTVEARIWDKLNAKIDSIMLALGGVMDEPEDLLDLVLGMTSPGLFRELFAGAAGVPGESLSEWFDARTGSFGGRDALETVRALVGHCARFDFREAAPQVPRLDLPDLRPFFVAMLELNRRKVESEGETLSFKTPDAWADGPGVRSRYDRMAFDRNASGPGALDRMLGVGHRLVEKALGQARGQAACVAALPADLLPRPLLIYRITDRSTEERSTVSAALFGVEGDGVAAFVVTRDWELLGRLNELVASRAARRWKLLAPPSDRASVARLQEEALRHLAARLDGLGLTFRSPQAHLLVTLWPGDDLEAARAPPRLE